MEGEAQDKISRELEPGEQLLWTGRPYQGLILSPFDVFLIPFGLAWLGFTVAITIAITKGPGPSDSPALIILPLFLAIGLYLVCGRFWIEILQRRRTTYGLTNQRAIIIRGSFRREVRSINLATMSDLSLSERRDRTGTIRFGGGSDFAWYASGMQIWMPGSAGGNSFERIPDARQVYGQIRAAQREA